ncbi:MAG: TetR/AcrR family transcriptional regulator C-terminal domain-containing protein [Paludibacter sp.]|nr:TetR/AcrR family transcriptional regulator C-terminal domain-containing protein [Paludibacter sp.]
MAISKEKIVVASIKILNRDGIEKLTMRTVAKELGIKASSLYWHVSGKLELYGAIAEHLCSQYDKPGNMGDVKDYLVEMLKSYRAMLLSMRDAVPIFENSLPITPKRVEIISATYDALLKLGIQKKNLVTVANLLNNYVLSFVADEVRFKNTKPETFADISNMLGVIDQRSEPEDDDFEGHFLYGLRVLFAGLEAVETLHTP